MQIRCPQCQFDREIDASKIPATAVMATCPRCKARFRFRSLPGTPPPFAGNDADALASNREDSNSRAEPSTASTSSYVAPPIGKPGDDPLPPGAVVPSFKPVPSEDASENSTAEKGTPEENADAQNSLRRTPQTRDPRPSAASNAPGFRPAPPEKSFMDRIREAATRTFNSTKSRIEDEREAQGEPEHKKHSEFINGDMAEVPWEMPQKYPPLQGLYQTILRVMFGAPRFFAALANCTGTLTRPVIFYILLGVFQTIVKLIWYQTVGPSITDPQVQELLTSTARDMSVPMTLILAPGLLALQLLFYSALFYLMLRLVEPERAVFATVLRVVAYSSAPLVVCAVPVLGPFVGLVWFALNCFMGCKYALNTVWYKVALALVPLYLIAFAIVMQLMEHLLTKG